MNGPRPVVVSYPRRRLITKADCLRHARAVVAARRASEQDTKKTEED